MAVPWYRKPIKGSKGQLYLQLGVATSLFLSFVIAPVWYEFLIDYKKKWLVNDATVVDKNEIQYKVYQKRLELRELAQKLIEENKKK
jgi:hypothetical protein